MATKKKPAAKATPARKRPTTVAGRRAAAATRQAARNRVSDALDRVVASDSRGLNALLSTDGAAGQSAPVPAATDAAQAEGSTVEVRVVPITPEFLGGLLAQLNHCAATEHAANAASAMNFSAGVSNGAGIAPEGPRAFDRLAIGLRALHDDLDLLAERLSPVIAGPVLGNPYTREDAAGAPRPPESPLTRTLDNLALATQRVVSLRDAIDL
jgi:hypothetical protein